MLHPEPYVLRLKNNFSRAGRGTDGAAGTAANAWSSQVNRALTPGKDLARVKYGKALENCEKQIKGGLEEIVHHLLKYKNYRPQMRPSGWQAESKQQQELLH